MNQHKKNIKIITILFIIVLALFGSIPTATADTIGNNSVEFNQTAEALLQEKLSNIVSIKKLNVAFNNFKINASQATIAEYQGNAEAYANSIVEAFEKDAPFGTSSSSNILTRGTANYTSSVFSGVPAGGVCWVKQDFRATVVNYTVISKYFLGNSYQTGICLFQWTPNYSWFKGNLNVHSKGTFHAIVKGSPISFSATFKAFFHTNKSSLYQEFQ